MKSAFRCNKDEGWVGRMAQQDSQLMQDTQLGLASHAGCFSKCRMRLGRLGRGLTYRLTGGRITELVAQ